MAEESGKQEGKAAAAEPRTYHRDRLIAESQAFFGHPSYVIEAALSTGRASNKVNFTTDEAERLIKQYLDHEVEIDHPNPEAEED